MKTVLVTGGSCGIGAQIARQFATQGYTVIINYNKSIDKAQQLKDSLVACGWDAHLVQADVSNVQSVQNMADFVKKYFKKLDVLVNNAGVSLNAMLQDTTIEQYDAVMDTNAKGAFVTTKYCLPLLNNSKNAQIINISSIWGTQGASCESVYSMSKFALVGLTKSLAKELSAIRVNCVCPPIVNTQMTANLSVADKTQFAKDYNVPILEVSEVASAVYSIATADYTGKVITFGSDKQLLID